MIAGTFHRSEYVYKLFGMITGNSNTGDVLASQSQILCKRKIVHKKVYDETDCASSRSYLHIST